MMRRRALFSISVFCSWFLGFGCSQAPSQSELEFDSATSFAILGVVPEGEILTESSEERYDAEIELQLLYSVGQLNALGSVGNLSSLKVRILSVEPPAEGSSLTKVRYDARFTVAWDRNRPVPPAMTMYFPIKADKPGRQIFFETYRQSCSQSASEPNMASGNYWYYFRPMNSNCPFAAGRVLPSVAGKSTMHFYRSDENTSGKYPEYGKVWEDGRLVVTAIFGRDKAGATSASDAGVAAFNRFYFGLIQTYGQPIAANLRLPYGTAPGPNNSDVRLTFSTYAGQLQVNILLGEKMLQRNTELFRQAYATLATDSDLVSYNGHAGYGENIQALAEMGSFRAGQYKIFFINGCDTYAYADQALGRKHAAINPGSAPSKYVDIITNAMPSYFHDQAQANLQLVSGLLNRTLTYRSLLAGMSAAQRAIVTGEEDNRWPQPF